ncbi:hypothetical protein E2K93_11135 [Thalassotalea sp. HSM 43]|uniref:hypothetical protein n=1 Tax=Thalassotalea sp. HSM 43 TaxID=2552945 RepID=UPI001082225D|nr:hypothetical protein [Thalassotalea sp. HSM 43]QBY04901.1 hypothetical protein E2K93_11135 [Thalassotalea sp. HSM 43]
MKKSIDALTDGNLSWFEKASFGVLNFFTGFEEQADIDAVTRGMDYYDEVHSKNGNNSSVSSCLDADSIEDHQEVADEANTSPGGTGGNNAPNGNVYLPGTTPISPGTEWCFVDTYDTVQFCWIE